MICRNGRIFRDLSTILVDNKPIIEEVVTLSHNAILVLPDFWEGVTMPDDGIRMNPGTKVEILRLSRQNWR